MSKKISNKILLVVLAAVTVTYVAVRYFKSQKTERTFKTELVTIDTSKVSSILLYPHAENGEEVRFTKKENKWSVQKKNTIDEVENKMIEHLLQELVAIKPQNLAAKTSAEWKDFQLTDSLATRVKVIEEGGKQTLDLLIGKLTPVRNGNNGGFQGNNVSGISYVRLAGENEVYGVNGFLPFTFNQPFNGFRNHTFVKFAPNEVKKVSFSYPADSSFTLIRNGATWNIAGKTADSTKISNYLNGISNLNNSEFVDEFTPVNPLMVLTIERDTASSIVVKCFSGKKENEYILNSSLNPKAYYTSSSGGVFSSLFKGPKEFN
jgi:hypothetical protein